MKKINSKTGKVYVKGDKRDDGYIFYRYRKTTSPKDGFFHMEWMDPERFKKIQGIQKIKKPIRRKNPKTDTYFRPGDKRDFDNRIFLRYRMNRIDRYGYYYEVWETPEKSVRTQEIKSKNRKNREDRYRDLYKNNKLKKRINPETRGFFKRGETDKNGKVFLGYDFRLKNGDFVGELWSDSINYHNNKIVSQFCRIRDKCKKKKIPFDINIDYVRDIFPKDMICPVLNLKMEWGDKDRRISPSIDRFIPELGYVKGNIRIVSNISNTIKSDRNFQIIEKIYFDFKKIRGNK